MILMIIQHEKRFFQIKNPSKISNKKVFYISYIDNGDHDYVRLFLHSKQYFLCNELIFIELDRFINVNVH